MNVLFGALYCCGIFSYAADVIRDSYVPEAEQTQAASASCIADTARQYITL